jgi:phage shock protein PspC (stress-responsive transcriptional regulator)
MYRSFTDRVFGGVCGGLAAILPINAWVFRAAFIVLSIMTVGAVPAVVVAHPAGIAGDTAARRVGLISGGHHPDHFYGCRMGSKRKWYLDSALRHGRVLAGDAAGAESGVFLQAGEGLT